MADIDKLWQGTRSYMMSGRTNPQPMDFVSDLHNSAHITQNEAMTLIQKVREWPGGNPQIINDTVIDIIQAAPNPDALKKALGIS